MVCDQRRLTFAELHEMSDRLGSALVERGVKRGDRVAIHLHNCVEAVVSIFATLKAGGTFVVISPTTKPDRLKRILNDCRATVLVCDGRNGGAAPADLFTEVASLTGAIQRGSGALPLDGRFSRFDEILAVSQPTPLPEVNIDLDLACLVYTSGTSGEPKAVMCDHSNVEFASAAVMAYLGVREDDVVLGVLPLSSSYGLYQLLMTVRSGGTLVLERSFAYPASILQRIQDERVTAFPGVPTIFATLLGMDRSTFDLSSLRYLTSAAAALPPAHALQLQDAFPGVAIFSMYGQTETKRSLYLPPDQLATRPGSVGIPIPGTEAWIVDEAGRRLADGEVGELVVRGRHVMRGYWDAPEATGQRFRAGALPGERLCHSGDLFRTDEDGYFYFVARMDDMIKCRGEKVAPSEVEGVLHMLTGVTAAVVGVPDAIAGQSVKAFVVCHGNHLSEADVISHCRAYLEEFKVPSRIEFRSELPMTSSGKVRKSDLE